MPRFPTVTGPETVTQGQLPYQNISASPEDFGAGLSLGLGHAEQSASQAYLQHAALRNEAEVNEQYNKVDTDLTNYEFDPQTGFRAKRGKEAVDAYAKVPDDLNAMYDQARQNLTSDAARRLFDSRIQRRFAIARSSLGQWADTEQHSWTTETTKATIDNLARTSVSYANDSDLFDQNTAIANLQIEKQGQLEGFAPDSDYVKNNKAAYAQGTWLGRAERIMLNDPGKVLGWVQGDGSPESKQLQASVQPEHLLTLQAHAYALIHKDDAAADRVENQAYTQIESGIPTTPQDKADRDSALLQAGRPEVVKELADEESAVQTAAHGTFQQQNDLLRDRETKLLQSGGSTKDWQRYQRLSNALKAIQTQAVQKPLDYAATRLGLPVDSINVSDFQDPSKLGALSQQLAKRAAVIDVVGGNTGIPPKSQGLLQPDEALQLRGMLQNSEPQALPDLLKNVYQGVGDPERFQKTLQQAFPGNDPLAGAAIIAATGGKIETGQEGGVLGFGSHPTYTTADEAASLISVGRRLLNPTEQDKKEKGDKASVPLPKATGATGMSAQFSEYVGNAFANAPGAAAMAYDTFRAAYAGLAARDGDWGGDASDAKDARIQQALKISLGNTQTFGDGSTAIAPWGMDQAEFKDQAEQKVAEQVAALHLPGLLVSQFKDGEIGLRASGFNKYDLVKSGQAIPGIRIDFNNRGALAIPRTRGALDDFMRQPQADPNPTPVASPVPSQSPASPPTPEFKDSDVEDTAQNDLRKGDIQRGGPQDDLRKGGIQQRGTARGLVSSRTENFTLGGTALERMSLAQRRTLPHSAPALDDFATAVERKLALPSGLLLAIKNAGERSESVGTNSVSPAGAKGVMQFMGATASAFGLKDPSDPMESIKAAGRYLRESLVRYGGNVPAAVADYDDGPKAAAAVLAGRDPPKEETRKYVSRVIAAMPNLVLAQAGAGQ